MVGVSQCEWRVRSKALADFANDTFSNSAFSQPQREGVCVLGQNILPPVKFWKMLKQELPLHIEFQIKFKLKIIFIIKGLKLCLTGCIYLIRYTAKLTDSIPQHGSEMQKRF